MKNKERIERLAQQMGEYRHDLLMAQSELHDYQVALGPLWTTQAGHRRPLSMFSTEHLMNLVDGHWLDRLPDHKSYAKSELLRRQIDTGLRKNPSLWRRFVNHALGRNK